MYQVVVTTINLKDIFFCNEYQCISTSPFYDTRLVRCRLIVFKSNQVLDVTDSILGEHYSFSELLRFYKEVRNYRRQSTCPSAYSEDMPQVRRKSKSKLLRDSKRAQEYRKKQKFCSHVESPESNLSLTLYQDPPAVTPLSDHTNNKSRASEVNPHKLRARGISSRNNKSAADVKVNDKISNNKTSNDVPSSKDLNLRQPKPEKQDIFKVIDKDRMRRLLKLDPDEDIDDWRTFKVKPSVINFRR